MVAVLICQGVDLLLISLLSGSKIIKLLNKVWFVMVILQWWVCTPLYLGCAYGDQRFQHHIPNTAPSPLQLGVQTWAQQSTPCCFCKWSIV